MDKSICYPSRPCNSTKTSHLKNFDSKTIPRETRDKLPLPQPRGPLQALDLERRNRRHQHLPCLVHLPLLPLAPRHQARLELQHRALLVLRLPLHLELPRREPLVHLLPRLVVVSLVHLPQHLVALGHPLQLLEVVCLEHRLLRRLGLQHRLREVVSLAPQLPLLEDLELQRQLLVCLEHQLLLHLEHPLRLREVCLVVQHQPQLLVPHQLLLELRHQLQEEAYLELQHQLHSGLLLQPRLVHQRLVAYLELPHRHPSEHPLPEDYSANQRPRPLAVVSLANQRPRHSVPQPLEVSLVNRHLKRHNRHMLVYHKTPLSSHQPPMKPICKESAHFSKPRRRWRRRKFGQAKV
mmetsp:Transcript_32179/g.67082  ORF Transcript_32179/g.67082 Transcript_32179/m.67082 type:complete len:351 (+) Transcript_32179:704-1756(+)